MSGDLKMARRLRHDCGLWAAIRFLCKRGWDKDAAMFKLCGTAGRV